MNNQNISSPRLNFTILDSLRGLAALYVCIGHARALLWIGGTEYLKQHPKETLGAGEYLMLAANMLTRLTTEFVIIFFVLSGFSIAHSLRNDKSSLPFYKRRFVRLYPPYLAALLWAMACFIIIQSIAPSFTNGTYATPVFDRLKDSQPLLTLPVFLKNLLYLPQLDGILRPFWSLTMEVLFYLLAPWLLRSKALYYSISAVLFLVALFGFGARGFHENVLVSFCFYNAFFAIGVAVYENFDLLSQKMKAISPRLVALTCAGLFLIMIPSSLKGWEATNAFLAAIMSSLLILHLLNRNIIINWLIGIGHFSYTLYITHFPTLFLFLTLYFTFTGNQPPYIFNNFVFIPAVFFCLLVAYTHYILIERRTKKALEKMRVQKKNAPASSAPDHAKTEEHVAP